MDPTTLLTLALACAPAVHPHTVRAIVAVESSANPHAIGVVGGALLRQPRSPAEALATARALEAGGWNYSVGLGQINRGNFARLGLRLDEAFEPCTNLAALQTVLLECYGRAGMRRQPDLPGSLPPPAQQALRDALSCYYSGNFRTGYRHGYVDRVVAAAGTPAAPPRHVPLNPPREAP
jgi:type IV secretion system protein VirB1